jgi:hypothetical protein
MAAAFYLVALATGAVTAIGYERANASQSGMSASRTGETSVGMPLWWLAAGQAIRADYEIEARFGAVTLSVAPPLLLRTSLQVATAHVEGVRTGSILFVAATSGWYAFEAQPSPLGGPRCGTASLTRAFAGEPGCPTYDVSYRVTWRLASHDDVARSDLARLVVPGPRGKLAVLRVP